MEDKILTRNYTIPDAGEIEVYIERGGYTALKKAIPGVSPDRLTQMVVDSGLRGRGGAGFPTGRKWSLLAKGPGQKYLVCNGHEKEPGTYKDQELMEKDPHLLVEGVLLSAYALGASVAHIFLHHEFHLAHRKLRRAVDQAYERGFAGKNILGTDLAIDLILHTAHSPEDAPRAYICGEETALLEGLEGRKCMPRFKPPYPAVSGLFGMPTVVNNVETLANLPFIVNEGPEGFRRFGTLKSPGTKIFSVSGPVRRPGNTELPLGTPLRRIIDAEAEGLLPGRRIKGILPGGSSVPYLTPKQLDVPMDFESLNEAGSQLGTAGIILIDETACVVKATVILSRFYFEESCGKCTPCREGTHWLLRLVSAIERGEGTRDDLDLILQVCDGISGKCLCALGETAILPIGSAVKTFYDEFLYHVQEKHCQVDGVDEQTLYNTIMGGG